jgi:hypothetical protein
MNQRDGPAHQVGCGEARAGPAQIQTAPVQAAALRPFFRKAPDRGLGGLEIGRALSSALNLS